MAVVKGKMKAGEKFSGKLQSVDTDENKVIIKADKEIVLTVNSITAEYIDDNFSVGDDITIEFDGTDYDVE